MSQVGHGTYETLLICYPPHILYLVVQVALTTRCGMARVLLLLYGMRPPPIEKRERFQVFRVLDDTKEFYHSFPNWEEAADYCNTYAFPGANRLNGGQPPCILMLIDTKTGLQRTCKG